MSVLLTTSAPSLQFTNPKNQAKFELGVACAIFLWDDLSTAVANGWGGPESAAKREWLVGVVIDLFDEQEVYTEDIEYRLLTAMIDEFDVTVETGSAMVVAQQIVQIYQDCAKDNFGLVDQLFERYKRQPAAAQVNVQNDEDDEDDEDEVMEDETMVVEEKVKEEPEVDMDGFTIVKSRR